MNKTTLIITATLIIVGCSLGQTANLKETPIQSQMYAELSVSRTLAQKSNPAQPYRAASRDDLSFGDEWNEKKSATRAALYSALLPGLGEYYVGNRKKARVFFGIEAASWLGFFAFRTYGNWKKDDYIAFAREKAGARLEGKSDDFLDWVGFYNDIEQFNTLGRVSDWDRPYLEDTPENHWRWQTTSDRMAYRSIKNSSKESFRRSEFVIGFMILTRIISVIDAIHDARGSGSSLFNDEASLDESRHLAYSIDVNPVIGTWQVGLSIRSRF